MKFLPFGRIIDDRDGIDIAFITCGFTLFITRGPTNHDQGTLEVTWKT